MHALICPKCNFGIFKEQSETIIKSATTTQVGLMEKRYTCTYCGHKEQMEAEIAQLVSQ